MAYRLLRSVYLFSYSIAIALIVIVLTLIFSKKRISFLKKEILIFIPLFIFLYFYLFNYNFFLLVRSNVFPQKKCTVEYNTNSNLKDVSIHLPPKSVFLYKTPAKVYYSKYNSNQCINFFNENLMLMKKNNKIKEFNYDDFYNKFSIILNNNKHFEICIMKDKTVRYKISRIGD